MTNLKDFKEIANDALNDIKVSEELKEKTLKELHKSRTSWSRNKVLSAACAAVVLVTMASKADISYFSGKKELKNGLGITTMMDGDKENTFNSDIQILENWNINTMEEAKEYLDGMVLAPAYIPEGFEVKEIMAAGPTKGDAISVVMEFEKEGRIFTVSQEKIRQEMDFKDSRKVDINGVEAYIHSFTIGEGDDIRYDTSIKWYINDRLYMVSGGIPEEAAIKVARELK